MKRSILTIVAAVLAAALPRREGVHCGRVFTRDNRMAYRFRMPAGFAGDVNRTHPANIPPGLIDENDPPTRYGNMCVVDTAANTLRGLVAGDASDGTALTPYGAIVRPYPTQQVTSSNDYGSIGFGAATPPTSGPADFLVQGFIMVQLNTGVTAPTKGGRVFVWCAATAGDHVQGGYETEGSTGNTVELDPRYTYNGPADENGITELACNN